MPADSKSDLALGMIEGLETLASQFEEVGDLGYFIFDAICEQFLYVSDGFGRIYDIDAKTHMQCVKSLDDDLAFVIEDDRERVLNAYQSNLCRGVNCVVEFRIKRTDGSIRWLRESSKALRIDNGKVLLTMGAIQDITDQRIFGKVLSNSKANLETVLDCHTLSLEKASMLLKREIRERERLKAEMKFRSNLDSLTGLPLLDLCCRHLEYAIVESKFTEQGTAVLFIGLDDFSWVNETLGRETGDAYLKDLAGRIKLETRSVDTLARVGGDEFVIILCGIGDRDAVQTTASRYLRLLRETLAFGKQNIQISGSIGIAMYPQNAQKSGDLLRLAEQAMRKVKCRGKNAYRFSDEGL